MKTIYNLLNNIYCLSQEASSTVSNLRVYPHIFKNPYSYRLYINLQELRMNTLESVKEIKLDRISRDSGTSLREVLSTGSAVEEIYKEFANTIDLPTDNFLVRKLDLIIESISLSLIKLAQKTPKSLNKDNPIAL